MYERAVGPVRFARPPGMEQQVEAGLRGYRLWLDRVFSVVTALVVVAVGYFVVTERVVPALRGEPVRVQEGERLAEVLEFARLGNGGGSDGEARVRLPDGRAVLLLVFNSTCQACYRTLPAWQRASAAGVDDVAVLAVGLDSDRRAAVAYARRNLPMAVVLAPDDPARFAGIMGVDVVPFTALLDPDGVVLFARQGSLDSLAADSLIRALGALVGS